MTESQYQLAGLTGFVVSGLIFLASGIRAGDLLTIAGSVTWILACAIWAVPFLKAGTAQDAGTHATRQQTDR